MLSDTVPLLSVIGGLLVIGAYLFRRARVAGVACDCAERIDRRVVLVTGANSGIGRQVASQLALRGGRVYVACRSLKRARQTVRHIVNETGNTSVYPACLDLNSFASIRRFVEDFAQVEEQLDILVNNAGCFYSPPALTEDGFTVTFQTNYLGHFLLTRLLVPLLLAASAPRVVFVSSEAHLAPAQLTFDCAGRTADCGGPTLSASAADPPPLPSDPGAIFQYHFHAYSQAKLALTVFATELARRLKGEEILVNCVDPGNVNTDIYRHYKQLNTFYNRILRRYFMRTCCEGAQTVIHCAVSAKIDGVTAQYFKECTIADANPLVRDKSLGNDLWELSERWTGLASL